MSKQIAFIFPGQGSQSLGMGKSFIESKSLAKELLEQASESISVDLRAVMFEDEELLGQTAYTQPAILSVSLIAHRLFEKECDLSPSLVLGHSLGEFSALSVAGALEFNNAVKLVHTRGKLMQQACEGVDAGMMAIVGLRDKEVEAVCFKAQGEGKKIWPANYNQNGQVVVAGIKSDLEAYAEFFKAAGAKRALLLNMSVASHCPLLESACQPFGEALSEVLGADFKTPVISNVTATAYSSKDEAQELLVKQLVSPVKYKQSIEAVAGDLDAVIEFGNGNVLKGLNKRIAKDLITYNVSDMKSLEQTLESL